MECNFKLALGMILSKDQVVTLGSELAFELYYNCTVTVH